MYQCKKCDCGAISRDVVSDWEDDFYKLISQYDYAEITINDLKQFISTQITKAKQETARNILLNIQMMLESGKAIQFDEDSLKGYCAAMDKLIIVLELLKKEYGL